MDTFLVRPKVYKVWPEEYHDCEMSRSIRIKQVVSIMSYKLHEEYQDEGPICKKCGFPLKDPIVEHFRIDNEYDSWVKGGVDYRIDMFYTFYLPYEDFVKEFKEKIKREPDDFEIDYYNKHQHKLKCRKMFIISSLSIISILVLSYCLYLI